MARLLHALMTVSGLCAYTFFESDSFVSAGRLRYVVSSYQSLAC
jgi:hypothetical protein